MKAKFGAIVVGGSGKLGGHVFAKNRSGNYIRTRVVPINPQTSYQTNARALFSAASQAWGGLTDAQRLAWNNASTQQARQNSLGDTTLLSGKALFASVYINLSLISVTPLTSPVAPTAGFAFTSVSATADRSANTLVVTFSAAIPATHKIICVATPSLSPSISFVKNQLRVFSVATSANTSPLSLYTPYIARYGSLGLEDNKITLTFIAVEITSGKASFAGSCSAIVEDV